MLLTITTTQAPAAELGFLLHKHPARAQIIELPFGTAHVFYPEASDARCTFALLLEVDPVGLVRDRRGPRGDAGALERYVNDRPYAASSFLSVAIARALGSALSGTSRERPELAARALPLQARLSVLPCRGGEAFLRRLFEPLGYAVTAVQHPLDTQLPGWDTSRYFTVELAAEKRLSELLGHLYVLVPVLDDDKHYWVGEAEVEKLLRHGEGWLAHHPEREAIAHRYLRHQGSLARQALSRLVDEADDVEAAHDGEEASLEPAVSLNEQRLEAVRDELSAAGATRVLDLGCGEGRLLKALLADQRFTELVGVDVSLRALEVAEDRLRLERLPERQRRRVTLLHGSLLYRDERLAGFDAAAAVEVIEHLEPARLPEFERALFGAARPGVVVITTPNREFNVRFDSLPAGRLRHRDHRFEWSRAEFADWVAGVAGRNGYQARIRGVGPEDEALGPPTQMAVFAR